MPSATACSAFRMRRLSKPTSAVCSRIATRRDGAVDDLDHTIARVERIWTDSTGNAAAQVDLAASYSSMLQIRYAAQVAGRIASAPSASQAPRDYDEPGLCIA